MSNPPKILFVMLEFPLWEQARFWGYNGHFGIVEGLTEAGAKVTVLPAMFGRKSSDRLGWLARAKELFAHEKFDQVWISLVHAHFDPAFLEWLATMAPVRVGVLTESLQYTQPEIDQNSALATRSQLVHQQLSRLTHVICVDEVDADQLPGSAKMPALWIPGTVPARNVFKDYVVPTSLRAVFVGSLYSAERRHFATHPGLKEVMDIGQSPEDATDIPLRFNRLNALVAQTLARSPAVPLGVMREHAGLLHALRRESMDLWMKSLNSWLALVNLPTFSKCFSGRVTETIGMGIPVIAFNIPHRPRNNSLYEAGREILFYDRDRPEQLMGHIRDLQQNPGRARDIALAAREKVLRLHTQEVRMRHVLTWLADGSVPSFN
jgi:hypothetical protein